MAAKFCDKCGSPLTPGAKFCINCGATVAGDVPAPEMPVREEVPYTPVEEAAPEIPYAPEEPIVPETPAAPEVPSWEQPYESVTQAIPDAPAAPAWEQPYESVTQAIPDAPAAPEAPAWEQAPYAAPYAEVPPVTNAAGAAQTPQTPVPPVPPPYTPVPPSASIPPQEPKKKRGLLIGIVIAAVAAVAVIAIVLVLSMKGKPQSPAPASTAESAQTSSESAKPESKPETSSAESSSPWDTGIPQVESSEAESTEPEAVPVDEPEWNEKGDYSGKVDDEGADSEGMKLPEVAAGETLYIGYGTLPDVGFTKIAMVLSADKKSVHGIAIYLKEFADTVGGVDIPFSTMQTSTTGEYELPVKDQSIMDSTIEDMHLEGDWIYVKMDYVFKNIVIGNTGNDQLIPLGETEFWLRPAG